MTAISNSHWRPALEDREDDLASEPDLPPDLPPEDIVAEVWCGVGVGLVRKAKLELVG